VYRAVAPCADQMTAPLHSYCADCDGQLDRFGEQPEITHEPLAKVVLEGYQDFDSPAPRLEAGCRTNKGCDDCPKLSSRPF
jgi:hypothetical protein